MWLARLADDPEACDTLTGPAKETCESGGGSSGGGGGAGDGTSLDDSLDPLSNLAHSCAKAAAWMARQVGDIVGDPAAVDFTGGGFLKQYAVVFAASTFVVLLLWLLAVSKRAIRGVPLTTAIGEAISLLWLAVATTAFMPLILYTVVQATAAVTRGIAAGIGNTPGTVFDELAAGLNEKQIGGGPLILIAVSLLVMLLCGALGLLLILRTLGLYVGAILGIPVFAGLVDKDLWPHVRKWSGLMAALILVEPALVIVIGLASAVQADGEVVTGIAITGIACGVAIALISKFPGWGDGVRAARMVGRGAAGAVGTVVGGGSATSGVRAGITTHSSRDAETRTPTRTSGTERKDSGIIGGIGAHSQRPPKRNDTQKNDDK